MTEGLPSREEAAEDAPSHAEMLMTAAEWRDTIDYEAAPWRDTIDWEAAADKVTELLDELAEIGAVSNFGGKVVAAAIGVRSTLRLDRRDTLNE